MKVRITASGLPVPIGTIMEVGDAPPAAWRGKCEPLIVLPDVAVIEPHPLDHDGDGRKGGDWRKKRRSDG